MAYLTGVKKCDSFCEDSRPVSYIDLGRYYCCYHQIPEYAVNSKGESILRDFKQQAIC